jgi:REP element-mobilizing transposase RayT
VANKLQRYYGAGCLHFVTTSCFRRLPLLAKPQHRDLLLEVLERVRRRYRFVVVGYVVMPEHIHLLMSEPERGDPSKVRMTSLFSIQFASIRGEAARTAAASSRSCRSSRLKSWVKRGSRPLREI